MRNKLFIILALITLAFNAIGQEDRNYSVSIETRNQSIAYANNASLKLSKGLTKESFPLIIKAINTDSTLHKSYELLYQACMTDQNYSDTIIQKFYIAKRIFDADDQICYYIATLYRMRNDFKKSISEYTKAIEFSKTNEDKSKLIAQYYSGRAYCYVKTGMFKEAIPDYTYYLMQNPDDAVVLINRGVCYQKEKNNSQAIADWKKASELGNPTAKTYLKRMMDK
jgi:tetratricopeptide (TPR) repeat protein